MSDFSPISWPDGGGSWISNDRIIAHEMVHAVMGRTTNFRDIPTWFKEGAAEFIAGADERLKNDLLASGGDTVAGASALISSASLSGGWVQNSKNYSTGYAAVKYLDSKVAGGIKTIMQDISLSGGAKTLDQAIDDNTTYTGLTDFINDFESGAGAAFIAGLDLDDTDVGAIGGGDDSSVVPNNDTLATNGANPLAGFTEIWPTIENGSQPLSFHLGSNSSQAMQLSLVNASSSTLGIDGVNVVNGSSTIDIFQGAIEYVSGERARLGAMQNRLEHAMNNSTNYEENLTASESRIRDTDMAKEIMTSTKTNILMQAAQAMMAQANQAPQGILQLLR